MRPLRQIVEYFRAKRLKRLEMDILSLRGKLNFDPRLLVSDVDTNTAEAFTNRIAEYRAWSTGDSGTLRKFYCRKYGAGEQAPAARIAKANYFWAKAPATARMVHSGIPGLISTRMADILFGGGITADVIVYKDGDGEDLNEDEGAKKKANELMQTMIAAMGLQDKLQRGATNESWGGHCFFKLTHDADLSVFPIIEPYDIMRAEAIKVRGMTKAIVFKTWYKHRSNDYRLDEIYSTTEEGDACITYRLFCRTGDGEREVDLFSIPQTERLFRRAGEGEDGSARLPLGPDNRFVYTGLKGMLAFEKPNRTPSLEFPDSGYGASDYEGALDEFDALDEIVSGNIHEIRTNKTRRYIPTTLLRHDPDHPGLTLPFDDFDDSYALTEGDQDQDGKEKIEVVTVGDKTQSFLEKWKSVLSLICNKAKISPYSLGITWLEAVGPSADSLRERNQTTLDMRAGKLALWKPFLEEMLLRCLQMYAWIRKNTDADASAFPDLPFRWENTAVHVRFGDYLGDSFRERMALWTDAYSRGAVSAELMVKELYPGMTEAERQKEVNRILFAKGMSDDSPMTLPGLTGKEE